MRGHKIALSGRLAEHRRAVLVAVLCVHAVLALRFASVGLDIDEFVFVREPYELVGGDYTIGYLREHQVRAAIDVAARSYWFYWKYRPLNAPLVSAKDQGTFAAEEEKFGYSVPARIARDDPDAVAKYDTRLIVPEPDRMYRHGAGKPLLPALLTAPQLGLVALVLRSPSRLTEIQFSHDYHPAFILVRLVQILAGLATVLLTYWLIRGFAGTEKALAGAALVGMSPTAIAYFPNIHHDSIMVPFLVLSTGLLLRKRVVAAGIVFGLALASKNAAVFAAPALVFLLFARELWSAPESPRSRTVRDFGRRSVIFCGLAILTLTPFANPVSYVQELLTPISGRAYDTRGEDIASYALLGQENGARGDLVRSNVRSEISLIRELFGTKFTVGVLAILGLIVMAHQMRGAGATSAWITVSMLFPAGAVFSYGMNYRFLMFIPSFAVIAAVLLPRRWVWFMVFVLLVVSVLYAVDPMTVHLHHTPVRSG